MQTSVYLVRTYDNPTCQLHIEFYNILGDYIPGPYDVTIAAGRTNYVLNITITDDNLLEAVENFNLTIESVSGGATVGNLNHTVVSIFDNDRK